MNKILLVKSYVMALIGQGLTEGKKLPCHQAPCAYIELLNSKCKKFFVIFRKFRRVLTKSKLFHYQNQESCFLMYV